MKYQTKFNKGDHVLYNSLSATGAARGTIIEADNDSEPHKYTIEPDVFKGERTDTVQEQHILEKV